MTKSFALLVLFASISASTAQAASLPSPTDNTPWQVKTPRGMTVEMTFRPDGSGQVKAGFISRDLTWSMKDGALCIGGLADGTSCMVLSTSGNTIVGTSTDGKQIVFKRA